MHFFFGFSIEKSKLYWPKIREFTTPPVTLWHKYLQKTLADTNPEKGYNKTYVQFEVCTHPSMKSHGALKAVIIFHLPVGHNIAWAESCNELAQVKWPHPRKRSISLPYMLSRGMRVDLTLSIIFFRFNSPFKISIAPRSQHIMSWVM